MARVGTVLEPSIDGGVRRRQQGAGRALPGGSRPPCVRPICHGTSEVERDHGGALLGRER